MSSGIKKDKKLLPPEQDLDKIVEPLDLSHVCVPFSIFFEEINPGKKGDTFKDIPFTKLDPELRTIFIKEFLE
jgi:hypothetical protein